MAVFAFFGIAAIVLPFAAALAARLRVSELYSELLVLLLFAFLLLLLL